MKPGQLVSANHAFQKLNSEIDELAMIERAQRLDGIMGSVDQSVKTQVLEYARELAMRQKTVAIKNIREGLLVSGVEIGTDYIENRLVECREARESTASATITSLKDAHSGAIWGNGARVI